MVTNTVITYPIPPYQNLPIHPEFYQPRRWVISGITLGKVTLVTTTTDNDYVVGQQVRFIIPNGYGTRQLSEQSGYVILLLSSTQFVVDIDSSQMDVFIGASLTQQPQVLAIGDVNQGQTNTHGRTNQLTYIPGSYINISPL